MVSTIQLTCPKFIPPILAKEVELLGYPVNEVGAATVSTEGTLDDAMRLNLHLRTAHRVVFLLKEFRAASPTDLYNEALKIEWEEFIPADGYISVVSAVDTITITNSQFANQRLKDAIVDRMRNKNGVRPQSGPDRSKCVAFLYWKDSRVMVYLDTTGLPLTKRGYRTNPHTAPMNEVLAAAVILSTQWKHNQPLINPMCGSGTLAIEAACIATNRAPQIPRTNFSFMHLKTYREETWNAMVDEARAAISDTTKVNIIATDRDTNAIMATRWNANRAGVLNHISVSQCDFKKTPMPEGEGIVIMNPEYGERLGELTNLERVYTQIGDWFKKSCTGKTGYIFTGNLDLAKKVGLHTSRKMQFFNADIECRLLEYELYGGSRKSKHSEETDESITSADT